MNKVVLLGIFAFYIIHTTFLDMMHILKHGKPILTPSNLDKDLNANMWKRLKAHTDGGNCSHLLFSCTKYLYVEMSLIISPKKIISLTTGLTGSALRLFSFIWLICALVILGAGASLTLPFNDSISCSKSFLASAFFWSCSWRFFSCSSWKMQDL